MRGITSTPAIDYANAARRTDWLSHPVLGDLSFDAFVRRAGNPVVRGRPPLEWPVNGFLFIDPVGGAWYLYAGRYPRGYYPARPRPAADNIQCTVFRSRDAGITWEDCGPVFDDLEDFCHDGDTIPAGLVPDASVVFHQGRYHLAYDWVSSSLTLADVGQPVDRLHGDSGVGYAWSERPEGPFRRHPVPVVRNSAPPDLGCGGKYRRFYASTLVRRKQDWLMLSLVDTPQVVAWGLVGLTAARPEGPYGGARLLLHVEDGRYQPPLLEYFPAFVHRGWIHAPGTSVAANRSFQVVHRVRVEDAMEPAAWELWQHGSVWHGEPVEHEAAGLWGQTFAGAVDARGRLHALHPSRDAADCGTLNLAARDWNRPYREQGAVIAAPNGPALARLRRSYAEFRLECDFALRGTMEIMWDHAAPLGPDRLTADAQPHPRCFASHRGLRLGPAGWELLTVDADGGRTTLAAGARAPGATGTLVVERGPELSVSLDGFELWRGGQPVAVGALAIHVERGGWLEVRRWEVRGRPAAAPQDWLCTEALLGAGQDPAGWELAEVPQFRFGLGAVHRGPGGRAKWNFLGAGVRLWSPRGPAYGKITVALDGAPVAEVDLRAAAVQPSGPVWASGALPDGPHALVLTPADERPLVVDACEVTGAA